MKLNSSCLAIGLVLLILIGCGLCSLIIGFVLLQNNIIKPNITLETQISVKHEPAIPTSPATQNTETISPIEKPSLNLNTEETLKTLQDTNVSEKDLFGLAKRYENKTIIKNGNQEPLKKFTIGDQRKFWVLNTLTNTYKKITAELYFETPHLYFWVEENIQVDHEAVANLSRTFEDKIYPTNREFFGSELTPGIDNDPHLILLYAHGLGNAAGYFSSSDSVPPTIDDYSNSAEMFYLSADYVALDEAYANSVIAHEFQHLIHFNHDRNEVSWISEGFSELAIYLNGYEPGGFDFSFASNPNIQLTFWPGNEQGDSSPHYGAAYMFLKYFLDRFGENATKALVAEPTNGMDSVDEVLKRLTETDSITKQPITADELFRDWSITNLLQDATVKDGKYQYKNYSAPLFSVGDLWNSTLEWKNSSVTQYGTRYYKINCVKDCTLEIKGQPLVKVLPVEPHSGNYFVWSNQGDESDMTLTREFDFSQVKGSVALQYWTWYDIEKDYDYLYLIASEDGLNWKILTPPTCTKSNPIGANYECGYSGKSNGWIQETVDLSQYAGKKVTLQFEYITDLAVNGEGFVLDDLSIAEIGYKTDFEQDLGGWRANGFARIQNQLPQKYLVTLINKGQKTDVQSMEFDQNEDLKIKIPANNGFNEYYLAISGATRYTQNPAIYEYRFLNMDK
jgi:immune inhibitor A